MMDIPSCGANLLNGAGASFTGSTVTFMVWAALSPPGSDTPSFTGIWLPKKLLAPRKMTMRDEASI
jgi:hypothetical protein